MRAVAGKTFKLREHPKAQEHQTLKYFLTVSKIVVFNSSTPKLAGPEFPCFFSSDFDFTWFFSESKIEMLKNRMFHVSAAGEKFNFAFG